MQEMFKGPDGKTSMMRMTTFLVVISIMGVFIAHNVIAMLHGGAFVSLGASEALLIAGSLGIKAGQAFFENKSGRAAGDLSAGSDLSEVAPRISPEDAAKVG